MSLPESKPDEAANLRARFEEEALPHLDALYGMAYSLTRNRSDAQDMVQEAVLRAYRAFGSFEEGTHLKAWLFTILRNTFINSYRRKKKAGEQQALEGDPEFSFFGAAHEQVQALPAENPARRILDAEELEQIFGDEVTRALDSLSEEYREVIYLCDVQEMSYQEIADLLEVPIGTVRSRLARARSRLQKLLWDYAVESGLFRKTSSRWKEILHHVTALVSGRRKEKSETRDSSPKGEGG